MDQSAFVNLNEQNLFLELFLHENLSSFAFDTNCIFCKLRHLKIVKHKQLELTLNSGHTHDYSKYSN